MFYELLRLEIEFIENKIKYLDICILDSFYLFSQKCFM